MISRKDLETPRTPAEMQSLIQQVCEDGAAFPNDMFYRRVEPIKSILEEYDPLSKLARHLNADLGFLSADSHEGPDGTITKSRLLGLWRQQIRVQITLVGEGHQSALGRELLRNGKPHFPRSTKVRDQRSDRIEQTDRVLSAPGKMHLPISELIDAIDRKIQRFRPGTDVLLVVLQPPTHAGYDTHNAKRALARRIGERAERPYRGIYLLHRDEVACIWSPCVRLALLLDHGGPAQSNL